MNAVIYARFSSHSQTEQSIEGQLRVCKEFAERNKIKIVGEYIERAKTGTNDNRPVFKQMIEDCKKKQFERILVYKLDRFSRNKYDNVIYKHKIARYGVKVISATEVISDTPEGVLMEGLLEMFAELYSKDLSQKVKRGMRESVLKGNFTGGTILFGYKVENQKIIIDEDKAQAVKLMFKEYANGTSKTEIVKKLNDLGYRTNRGKKLTINSINKNLANRKYTGYYKNEYIESFDYYPQIITKELFEQVQEKLKHNQRFGGKSKIDFILSGKLFCGHCGATMIGTSGTSKTGKTHAYYTCFERKKNHTCKKKNEQKQQLEDEVIQVLKDRILKPANIEEIANNLVKQYDKDLNHLKIKEYEGKLKDIDKRLDDITSQFIETRNRSIIARLNKEADDLTELQEIYQEQIKKITLATKVKHTTKDIVDYLKVFIYLNDDDDIKHRQKLIDVFVNSIYVFDDYFNIYIDILDDNETITLEEAQNDLNEALPEFAQQVECSTKKIEQRDCLRFFIFLL